MTVRTRLTRLLAAAFLFCAALSGQADDYPSKPVHLIVPFPAGSISDSVARLTAERAAPQLGVPIVVENRAGATGTIGADHVARSKPDGYTILYGAVSTLVMFPATGGKLTFDPVKDLAPVTRIGHGELVLVVPPSLGATSVAEFIALAKQRPGQLSYGTMGVVRPRTLPARCSRNMLRSKQSMSLTKGTTRVCWTCWVGVSSSRSTIR